jgi:riboflavin-specific deaminase-like protein
LVWQAPEGPNLNPSSSASVASNRGPIADWAWQLLTELRLQGDRLDPAVDRHFGIARNGRLVSDQEQGSIGQLSWQQGQWLTPLAATEPLIDLYLPLCQPTTGSLLGHLGQSLDGYIATASGDSDFVNDQENIIHLHRLRALHDAVIIGAGTIEADDPQLTTRRVAGPNPTRVVLDPRRRLSPRAQVFTDAAAATLLVAASTVADARRHGQARVLSLPAVDGRFDLAQLVDELRGQGLKRIFVEGGGATVSRFLDAGLLDRLQIAVAPVLTGRGKPGLRLAEQGSMRDCLRPEHRVFAMGRDILFDYDLRAGRSQPDRGPGGQQRSAPVWRIR